MMIAYLLLLIAAGPIDWQNPVQEKNFYLLSTIEKSPALQSAVRADSFLSAVAAAKRESLKQIQACPLQAQCFIQPMKWSDTEIRDVGSALASQVKDTSLLRRSALFQRYHSLSDAHAHGKILDEQRTGSLMFRANISRAQDSGNDARRN